ncbi:MAG: HD domain-containing protein [Armatimonadetes bacterium]|nr:HD domain-containing protein [Armatimonadota bacterium]
MSATISDEMADLGDRRKALLEELGENPSGIEWCHRHTTLADDAIKSLFGHMMIEFNNLPPIAVIATGGFGRRELAPYSDVDLTVVPDHGPNSRLDDAIKWLFRQLHDSFAGDMKLKVGYALRYVSDAPGLDATTLSGLIDGRLVVGSQQNFDGLIDAIWESFPVAEFIIAKMKEREQQTLRTNDTPYAAQPHLKLGSGGLRCFNTANWIRASLGEEMIEPSVEYKAILEVRNLLHVAAGKQFDQLTYEKRQSIADVYRKDPFELGSEVAQSLIQVRARYERTLTHLQDAEFPISKGVNAVKGTVCVDRGTGFGAAAQGIALGTQLSLAVSEAKPDLQADASPGQLLVAVIAGEPTLRNLDRAGVLEFLLPELTACRTLMPRDMAHEFGVFEHTLRVIRNLDSIPEHGFLGELKSQLRDLGALYLAALLHDVGKVDPTQKHSDYGAELAEAVCTRWGLYDSTRETVCWLVKNHLLLDRTIRMRDVQHPDTAREFAEAVKTPERLAMLAILTWADASAVSDHAWSQTQDAFLAELYDRTLEHLLSPQDRSSDPSDYRRRILSRHSGKGVSSEELEEFVNSMPAHYVLSTEPEIVKSHVALAEQARGGEVIVLLRDFVDMAATEITVCCSDAPRLLTKILGVLYALDLSIIGIRASTSEGAKPVAIDTITASFGRRPIPRATAQRVTTVLTNVLKGQESVDSILRDAGKSPERKQNVLEYNFVPGVPSIIEIRAPRGRGMAYRIARTLSERGWDILGARVGQWAGSGAAAFYVANPSGGQLTEQEVAEALSTQ